MNKTIFLNEVNNDNIQEILDSLFIDDSIDLYISSPGGDTSHFQAILHTIENRKEKTRLVGYYMCSNAFNLFYKYKGEKILVEGAEGFIHSESISVPVFRGLGGDIKIRSLDGGENKRLSYTTIYEFLSNEELEQINEGRDIHLNYERLKKIFN